MKRRITVEQLQELTPKQLQILSKQWKPTDLDIAIDDIGGENIIFPIKIEDGKIYEWPHLEEEINNQKYKLCEIRKECILPLLDIGQMIELLDQHNEINPICIERNEKSVIGGFEWMVRLNNTLNMKQINASLCDALWQAVKQVL
jgi:hypothetical protein